MLGLWKGLAGMETGLAALVAAVASAVAVVVTALRKRRDVDVDELLRRIADLTSRVERLESDLDTARDELVHTEHHNFVLRRTLAANGIADPTLEVS